MELVFKDYQCDEEKISLKKLTLDICSMNLNIELEDQASDDFISFKIKYKEIDFFIDMLKTLKIQADETYI